MRNIAFLVKMYVITIVHVYLQGRSKVVAAIVDNKLLVRLTMEGRCVGNVVSTKEMRVYVC